VRTHAKSVDQLSGTDLDHFPLWTFVNDDSDELLVRPVMRTRVRDLSGMLVGTYVTWQTVPIGERFLGVST
jgi:hypothetical protein